MQNDMSVNRLREIIEETRLIPQDKQTLTFDGHVLENGRHLIEDYGALDKSEITLSLPLDFTPNFKIYIKVPGGLVIKRIVNRTELVSSLKWSIEDATKIPVSQQALSYGSWLLEDNMRLGEYNLRNGSVVRVLRRDGSSCMSTIGSQNSQTRSIENYEEIRQPSLNSSGNSVAESSRSKRASVVEDYALKKPSPIKRFDVTKIPELESGDINPISQDKPEKIEPSSKTSKALQMEKIGKGESLRLNLPDTEIYKSFRQVLGEQMAQNGTE
nr:polyubiquitin [Hymenolepis microstoma]CUU98424.1 polyubiquitin [Hymenolepis microstoma]